MSSAGLGATSGFLGGSWGSASRRIASAPDKLVIKAGELLGLVTNGLVRADVHALAVPPGGAERYFAFFLGARCEATVPAIPLPEALASAERGVTAEPLNPIFHEVGFNHLRAGCARTRT